MTSSDPSLNGQVTLQSVFVLMRAESPAVAALHPVNGFLILLVTWIIARTRGRHAPRSSMGGRRAIEV